MRESTYRDLAGTIEHVVRYIQNNLDVPMDIDSLANVAGFSPFHFQRSFQRMVGESPIAHIRRIRLERAAHHIRHTLDSISYIAADAGFGSLAAFSRAFEESFSVPPSRYRNSTWTHFWQTAPSGIHYDPDGNFAFQPLARRGTPSKARIEYVPERTVIALRHEGPVQFINTLNKLNDWLNEKGIDYSTASLLAFTHEPKKPINAWKVRGYMGYQVDKSVPLDQLVEKHTIGSGEYMIKRYLGMPSRLGDFWARAWNEDLWQLRARPRLATAINQYRSLSPHEFEVDIYLPVYRLAN